MVSTASNREKLSLHMHDVYTQNELNEACIRRSQDICLTESQGGHRPPNEPDFRKADVWFVQFKDQKFDEAVSGATPTAKLLLSSLGKHGRPAEV